MDSGHKTNAAVGGFLHGQKILCLGDLVHCNDLRIGRAQQHRNGHGLGATIHDIRMAANLHLCHALHHNCHLPPLIHQGNPMGRDIFRPIG